VTIVGCFEHIQNTRSCSKINNCNVFDNHFSFTVYVKAHAAKKLQELEVFGTDEAEETMALEVGAAAGESALRQIVVNSNTTRATVWPKEICEVVKKKYNLDITREKARGHIKDSKMFARKKKGVEEEGEGRASASGGDNTKRGERGQQEKPGRDEVADPLYEPIDESASSSDDEVPTKGKTGRSQSRTRANVSRVKQTKSKPIGPLEESLFGKYPKVVIISGTTVNLVC
jgi:hypothetical protein